MKKLLLFGLILAFVILHVYGQATEEKDMMDPREFTGKIAEMIDQMAGMMGKMSTMMMEEMPPPDIRRARQEIMRDLSQQMLDVSKMVRAGGTSEKEMRGLQDKMADIQKRISQLGAKE